MKPRSTVREMRKILFIAATHGNETIGVNVLRRIEQEYTKEEYGYDWIIGNERAYEKNIRFIEADLNRSAPGDITSGVYEVRRAAEIAVMAKDYDIVIDIHGTSTDCGVVTIIPYPTEENLDLAESISLERNVVWFSESSTLNGPLAQHVGVPAIELECGPKNDVGVEVVLEKNLRAVLENNRTGALPESLQTQAFYEVYGKLVGGYDPSLADFRQATIEGEVFYPFLSGNEYASITCYKMKKTKRNQITTL